MKNTRFITVAIIAVLALHGCVRELPPDNDPEDTYIENGNLLVSSDPGSLANRISYKNEIVPIIDTDTSETQKSGGSETPEIDLTKNYVFKLVAEVDPPVFKENVLQATHVAVIDGFAFVTYNTRGDVWQGGIEILDISDIRNPVIIASAILENADVNSIDYSDGRLFVVGATGDYEKRGFTSAAFLEVISLNGSMEFESVDTLIDISSYAGTDIKLASDQIFATSGSAGGLAIFNNDFSLSDTRDIPDARSVAVNSDFLYVLQGQEGIINVFDLEDAAFIDQYLVGGATIPESKSELAVSDEYILAALNEGGLAMLNLDGSLKQRLPKPFTPRGELDEKHVTNSVTLNGDLVLVGNGESGIHVGGLIAEKNDSLWMLGAMRFGGSQSANFVESKGEVIFVATGLGGLKILTVGIDEGVPDEVESTEPCETMMAFVDDMFPERKDLRVSHPDLFEDQSVLNIYVKEESPVYVTFIDEGAGLRNTFGYYSYPEDNPPESVEDLEKYIVFPNVSKVGEGGGLAYGDRVQLGTADFPAGTVIGFYVVVAGWKNGLTVDGAFTQYTDRRFNKDEAQQTTLFLNVDCNDIVLTFEDIRLSSSSCDFDYNDIILTIKDSKDPGAPITRLDLEGLPRK